MKRALLAVTLGDPAGIGPEVVLGSLARKEIYEQCLPIVIGDAQALSLRTYRTKLKIRPILNPAQARCRYGTIDVLHIPSRNFQAMPIGEAGALSGENSACAVKKSVELAVAHIVQGIVHAPISKLAWKMAGVHYPGHTELIAGLCGVKEFAMAIVSEPLRTVLVTRHIPLSRVSKQLKPERIVTAIALACEWLCRTGIKKPRIGVCALNPHAGENGLLGDEEIRCIQPAIRRAQKKLKLNISGPLPPDTAYRDHKLGLYDALITMYHDQSLIPLKLHNPDKLVNITLGLPFVRTSPGHGTAFDIAGKNRANPKPMVEAILTAAKLCRLRY